MLDLHHVHIFASDASATIEWWQKNLGAVVSYDGDFGGSRNIFMKVGQGRINVYDQQPRGTSNGAYHNVGIRVEGLSDSETAWLPMASNFDPILENSVTGDI